MKIAVYFNSGNKAVFEYDKMHLVCKPIFNPKEYIDIDDGVVVVNWDNVCFMKVVEEKQDDDE